jgi:hypothetical protein
MTSPTHCAERHSRPCGRSVTSEQQQWGFATRSFAHFLIVLNAPARFLVGWWITYHAPPGAAWFEGLAVSSTFYMRRPTPSILPTGSKRTIPSGGELHNRRYFRLDPPLSICLRRHKTTPILGARYATRCRCAADGCVRSKTARPDPRVEHLPSRPGPEQPSAV